MHMLVFYLHNNNATINILNGVIKARQYKTLRLNIYPYNKDIKIENETPVLTATVQAKQLTSSIELNTLQPGLYIAVIDDARNGFTLSFTGSVTYGLLADSQNRVWTLGRNEFIFAVKRVKQFQIKNEGVMTLRSPKGRVIDLQKKKGLITIEVKEGEDGIWKIQKQNGIFHFQNILPFVSAEKEFLLRNEE
jgi:hypothetical protein